MCLAPFVRLPLPATNRDSLDFFQWGLWVEGHPRDQRGFLYMLQPIHNPTNNHTEWKVVYDRGDPSFVGIPAFPRYRLGRILNWEICTIRRVACDTNVSLAGFGETLERPSAFEQSFDELDNESNRPSSNRSIRYGQRNRAQRRCHFPRCPYKRKRRILSAVERSLADSWELCASTSSRSPCDDAFTIVYMLER